MANITLNNVYQCKTFFQMGAQVAIQTYYLKAQSVTPPIMDDDLLLNSFSSNVGAAYCQCMTSSASYIGATIQNITTSPPPAQKALPQATPGTAGSNQLPGQVTAVVTRKTLLSGPSGRGRLYLPFLDQTAVDGATGYISVAFQNAFELWIGNWFPNVTMTSGGGLVELKSVLRQAGVAVASWPYLQDLQLRTKFGTQRRRGEYGKTNQSPF